MKLFYLLVRIDGIVIFDKIESNIIEKKSKVNKEVLL